MPFLINPPSPIIEEEDDQQEGPPSYEQLLGLGGPSSATGTPPERRESPYRPSSLTRGVMGASGSLAQQLAPGARDKRGNLMSPEPTKQAPELSGPEWFQSANLGLRKGMEMMYAAGGVIATTAGRMGLGGLSSDMTADQFRERLRAEPEAAAAQKQALDDALIDYGVNLRRTSVANIEELMKATPEGTTNWLIGEVAAMAPMMFASVVTGGAAASAGVGAGMSGVGATLARGFAGAMGVSYPIEKAFLQSELEQVIDEDAADLWATLGAVPMAALEAAFEGVAASRLGRAWAERGTSDAVKRGFASRLGELAKRMGEGSIVEGITEAAQEAVGEGVVAAATGEAPDWGETRQRLQMAALAGAVGGSFYGGVFNVGTQSLDVFGENRSEAQRRSAEAQIAGWDPSAAEVGTETAGRRLVEMPNGRKQWREVKEDGSLGRFAKAPTKEELRAELLGAEVDASAAETVATATAELAPSDVPVVEAVEAVTALSGRTDLQPGVVELNVRSLAASGSMRRQGQVAVRSLTAQELANQKAALELLALDPESDADHATRVTALARKRAIEYAERRQTATAPEQLDVTIGARRWAQLDDAQFDILNAQMEANGNEIQKRQLREARQIRAAGGEFVRSAAAEVNDRLSSYTMQRSRGVEVGTEVVTEDGTLAKVESVRPSGFLEVITDTGEVTVLSPNDVAVVPQAGQTIETTSGEVATVVSLTEDKVTVSTPDGNQKVISAAEVESLKPSPQRITEAETAATAADPQTRLPRATPAIDRRSGQAVEVVSFGQSSATLSDGQTIALSDLNFESAGNPEAGGTSDGRLVSEIRETGEIPTFTPGTTPSGGGRHINFLQIPQSLVEQFRNAVLNGDNSVSAFLRSLPREGGLFMVPQPVRDGYVTYAVELPADSRNLTDASKKILGALGGKKVPLHRNTLRGRVEVTRTLDPNEVGVMEVPSGLLAAVDHGNLDGDYLRRLVDLNFDVDPEVGAAVEKSATAAKAAADARIDGPVGVAEVREIESTVARAEVGQAAVEAEVSALRRFWDSFKEVLYDGMTPRSRTKVDVLNETTRDGLLELPGVSEALADEILAARDERGGAFNTLDDLLDVRNVGPATVRKIRNAIQAGEVGPGYRIGERRELALKEILDEMPGRHPGQPEQPIAFRHRDNPSFILVIDKEIIPGSNDAEVAAVMESVGQDISDLSPEDYRDAASRAVYHIKYITPEGNEVRARTIGTAETTVNIPAHFAVSRGGIGTPPANAIINQGLADGKTLDQIVEWMKSQAREVERVRLGGANVEFAILPGQPQLIPTSQLTEEQISQAEQIIPEGAVYEVITRSENGETVTVQPVGDDNKITEPFEIPASAVSAVVGRQKERNWDYTIPRRLTQSEILDQVVSDIRRFDRKAYQLSVGEWRSQIPGVYGSIRRRPDGAFEATVTETPSGRHTERVKLGEVTATEVFETRESAEGWLRAMDFSYASPVHNAQANFAALPPVEQLGVEDMYRAEIALSKVIDHYARLGYTPQPVQDYAVAFALRFTQERLHPGYGGLFGSRAARRSVGIEDISGAMHAARRGERHAMPQQRSPEVHIQDGVAVVEAHSPTELANDVRVFDGILLEPWAPVDPAAIEQAKALYKQQQHRERFLDAVAEDGLPVSQSSWRRLVDLPDGRTGILVDSKPGTNEVVVQTNVGGEQTLQTFPKEKVTPVRHPDRALDYLRTLRDVTGEVTNFPATPEMGSHPYDALFGLENVTNRDDYIAGLARRVKAMVGRINIAPDGNIVGNPVKSIDGLAKAWVRMKELGISQRDLPEASRIPAPLVTAKGGLGQPSGEKGLIPRLAHDLIAQQYSDVSPYGELVARTKLGLVSNRIRNQINEQAAQSGIDPDLPLYRKAEELIRYVWDPEAAHALYQMRADVGALMFSEEGVPEQGLELRPLASASTIKMNGLSKWTMLPKTAATKSPTLKVLFTLVERARTDYGNMVRRGSDVIKGLMAMPGMTKARKQEVIALLENDALAEVMETPATILSMQEIIDTLGEDNIPTGYDWYQQYRAMREIMTEARRVHIWTNLVRGFHPEPITFEKGKTPDEVMKRENYLRNLNGLSANERRAMEELVAEGQKFYDLQRTANPAYSYSESQATLFVEMLDTYETYADIPKDVRDKMPERMKDEFDFWSRYGIKNYAPSVLRGRHKVYMKKEDGSSQLVGFAPDVETFERFVFLASRGEVEGMPASGRYYLEAGMARADDIDMDYLGPARFKKLYAQLAKTFSGEEGRAATGARDAIRALRVGSDPATPRDVHTLRRTDDTMAQLIEDPYERALIYWARTARAKYTLRISNSYETARDLDPSISRAEGVEAVFPNQDYGVQGSRHALWYAQNMRDTYMGEPSAYEEAVNTLMAIPIAIANLSPAKVKAMKERMDADPEYSVFYDPFFLEAVHNADFASKAAAQRMTSLQSVMRLGLNFTGAAINGMQHILHTPAYLIARGAETDQAIKWATQGMTDSVTYWRNVAPRLGGDTYGIPNPVHAKTEKGQALADFAEQVGIGVVPGRAVAGPGMGIAGDGPPLFFDTDPLFSKVGQTLEWAMMLPFSTAERQVRLAAAFSARRMAEAQGLDNNAAVALARDVIDNTQFQYYDQALPPAMRGSLQRILFQFQPFVVNSLSYEKNMLLASLGRGGSFTNVSGNFKGKTMTTTRGKQTLATRQAQKAAAFYWFSNFVMGGAARFAASPWLAPFNFLASILGADNFEELLMAKLGQGERYAKGIVGTHVPDPELLRVSNLIKYGLPGLAGLQLSGRIGVGGLSLDPTDMVDLLSGPTGGMIRDTYAMLKGTPNNAGFLETNPRDSVLGFTLGGAAQFLGARYRLSPLFNPLAATALVGGLSDAATGRTDGLWNYLHNNENGRRFKNAMLPNVATGLDRTFDVFSDGIAYDANFQERRYPSQMGRLFESATSIIGSQTVMAAEERAYQQYRFKKEESYQRVRSALVQQAATQAMEKGLTSDEVQRILRRASTEFNIPIGIDDVQDAVLRRRESPSERMRRLISQFIRVSGQDQPSGRP
jgi:DNA uptake protein ComE-like DNA-binding protein/preprotein translocase subunit YajC